MGINVITGVSTDALARMLAKRVDGESADPFTGDLVVVPTRGVERYLTATIADHAGICANIDLPTPAEFLHRVTAGTDQWEPDRLVWPLLAAIDDCLGEAWAEPIAEHLRDWRSRTRRWALARRVAALFDAYAMERPELLRRWEVGEPADVTDDLRWQYELWRAVRTRVGSGPLDHRIVAEGLPRRFAVFGPTRLPERLLEVLRVLAQDREVDLYLPVASTVMWDDPRWSAAAGPRSADASRAMADHPLLRSLGRDARELRQRVGPATAAAPAPAAGAGQRLLHLLQSQIAANAESTIAAAGLDCSLQVHACHGPLRQVEVLREVILSVLHDDPTLQPRDILIMTPDLDEYAPFLTAVFADPDPRIADLRLRIADRSPEQHNEVLLALDALLRLADSRMGRSAVLDVLKIAVVRNRMGLSEQEVLRIEELAESANVRWGLDREHRAALGVDGIDLGSWSWGLDRMALGTALTDEALVRIGEVLPLPDVGGGDVGLIGRFAEFVDHLSRLRERASGRRTLREWVVLLHRVIDDFTTVSPAETWQDVRARGALDHHIAAAGDDADRVDLSLVDIRHMLGDLLQGRPSRAAFRLGGMTACRLEPMRSVPYKVIALLGMDDGTFPRNAASDGDDVLLRAPRIGERDPRSEDRQLLLDAIMAARQHLIITYTGRDERLNDERQPAVPIAELIDLLPGGDAAVRHHPLQPFDPRNFDPAAPFSHDEAALAGARASIGPKRRPPFLAGPLPPPDPVADPSLDSLAKYLKSPVATFFEQRLGIRGGRDDGSVDELVPIALPPLDRYQVGEPLLQSRLRGDELDAVLAALRRGGLLAPEALGDQDLAPIDEVAARILANYREAIGANASSTLEVEVALDGGRTLRASVRDVFGDSIVRATFAKVKAKQALGVWPELLALAACLPQRRWKARIEAREGHVELTAPSGDQARAILQRLVDVWATALQRPSPVTPDTALAYLSATGGLDAAAAAWEKDDQRNSSAMVQLLGRDAPFEELLAERPLPVEACRGETTRFACLARGIYGPLLDANPDAGVSAWPKGGKP